MFLATRCPQTSAKFLGTLSLMVFIIFPILPLILPLCHVILQKFIFFSRIELFFSANCCWLTNYIQTRPSFLYPYQRAKKKSIIPEKTFMVDNSQSKYWYSYKYLISHRFTRIRPWTLEKPNSVDKNHFGWFTPPFNLRKQLPVYHN